MRTERQLINLYLKDIRHFQQLSRDREKVLLSQYQKNKNPEALATLINCNLRFVVSVAVKYQHQGLTLLELINEGNLGLLEAIKRFNLQTFGSLKFISYAVWWIRQSIMKAIYDKSRLVRAPINKGNKVGAVNRFLDLSLQEFGYINYAFIAKKVGIKIPEAITILNLNHNCISMDAPLDGDEDKEIRHLIADKKAESPETLLEQNAQRDMVTEMVGVLSEKEKNVIKDYYGLGTDASLNLDQISKKLKVSKERVRQIRNKALDKMKKRDLQRRAKPRRKLVTQPAL